MTRLVVRLSRRAIAAAILNADELTFLDGRHLTSRRQQAVLSGERYLRRICEVTRPAVVVVDAPVKTSATTASLLDAVRRVAQEGGARVQTVSAPEVLSAYGVPPVASRIALRKVISDMFAPVAAMTSRVQPYVADAVAVALYTEAREALEPARA